MKELLEAGSRCAQVRATRRASLPAEPTIRSQFGVVFNWDVDKELRGAKGVEQLKLDAVKELKAGRSKLLDFVKKHRATRRGQLDYCWDLMAAPGKLQRLAKSRVEILFDAAVDKASSCASGNGRCDSIYSGTVACQGITALDFQHSIFETLPHGRRKGNVFMVVGDKDTGKTTFTGPARLIFNAMPTPQADSFCPIQDAMGL